MPPRRSHTKSRNGCVQCKQRRIKCDETPGSCVNCKKRELSCLYVKTPPIPARTVSTSSVVSMSPPSKPESFRQITTAPFPNGVYDLARSVFKTPPPSYSQINIIEDDAEKSSAFDSVLKMMHANAPAPELPPIVPDSRRATPAASSPYNANTPATTASSGSVAMPSLSITDLDLLHMWTTETCKTLCSSEATGLFFRYMLPKLAMQNSYLMRIMLALSALHLAKVRPQHAEAYQLLAAMHQHQAIVDYRVSYENGGMPDPLAAHLFSSLLSAHALAAPKSPGSLGIVDAQSGAAEWVLLIRGVRIMGQTNWRAIAESPFRDIIRLSWVLRLFEPAKSTGNLEIDRHLEDLVNLCSQPLTPQSETPAEEPINIETQVEALPETAEDPATYKSAATSEACKVRGSDFYKRISRVTTAVPTSPNERPELSAADRQKAYSDTVHIMQRLFYIAETLPPNEYKSGPAMSWPAMVPDDFFTLLCDHDPLALVIVAYYAVLLHRAENTVQDWWINDWPRHLVQAIDTKLPESWKPWLAWPAQNVGL